jgi:hypothetical protein
MLTMKTMTLTLAACATLAFGGAAFAAAQAPAAAPAAKAPAPDLDQIIALLRKDVRAGKADILGKTMALDATQAAAFWPVYKQYQAELEVLGDDRLNIIKDFAEHYDSLNDAKALGLLERSFVVEEKKLALQRKYKDEFLKVLPAKVVARFFQVETRLNNLINLKVSNEIPLVN